MVARIWHGYTTRGNADRYERLLLEEVFPSIESRSIVGYRGIQLLRGEVAAAAGAPAAEVEFVTIMWFDSLDAVRAFAGSDYEAAYVPEEARRLLSRFDEASTHYDVRATRMTG